VKSLFVELDSTYCPITFCKLSDVGCPSGNIYSYQSDGTDPTFTNPSTNVWKLEAQTDYKPGYTINMCVRCKSFNPDGTLADNLIHDNIEITQKRVDCTSVLTHKSSTPSQTLIYDSTASSRVDTNVAFTDFFDNSETTRCNI